MEGKKRLLAAAVLMTVLSGCAHEPPPYESRYTPPPPVAPPPPPLAAGASFVDDFERPDTDQGLDEDWELQAAPAGKPLAPVSRGALIRDGHYVSSDDSNTYAVQILRGTVRRIGAEGRWTRVGEGGDETLIMGIAADGSLDQNQVQLTASPTTWEVRRFRDSATPQPVARGTFNPPLAVNGTYRFEMDVEDGSVTVRVPGVEEEVRLGTVGLLSEHAYWQHFSPPAEVPIGNKFCIDTVWAAEEGQPLSPVPTE
ncbi:hypothetical protein [Mycobacterium sp. 236(2023)]|uniref:hypothetical protein n=1 Tax=Mycobacterium sp. 236(2023) TaxID=3038163 RepID=UPI002414F986|nr:hypothetical protein [Mycobacterium sp. 236(2023)]MDG4663618.1 hypothetical protein [Mycobacterium sp. 236(2023)]